MGMVFLYEDERETIPVIQTTTGLEYDITTKIKKLVDKNKETIAITKTGGQENVKNETISHLLGQRYNIRNVNLAQAVAENISLLLNLKSES